ncbi:hypothetical protein RhiirA4_485197 [Rhizophagus irregularis]|uniref:Uncharacterized protein n=1 Tax=Rhizophagus irregularis TaxID=588596 RepID=A0A2I1HPV7_9GLOM|nr:hypothetical protein RhiirA4_485197 [Rhizophagus irregularis]
MLDTQAKIFNSLINRSSLQPIERNILEGHIDWNFTSKWTHYNPTTSPTSEHAEAVTTMLTLMLTSAYVIHYDQTQETSSQQHRKTCYWSYIRP